MARIGEYELETEFGSGSTGTVWTARRTGPVPQVVAVKRLRIGRVGPTERGRIRQEAAVLTELDHPHVVRVIDVLQDEEGLALVLQHAAGGSLEALLRERPRLSPGEVVALAAPLADALASAHRRGILHGDVKPANVLFTSDGEPLLGDFGVARALGTPNGVSVAGSAPYLAPEVLASVQPEGVEGADGVDRAAAGPLDADVRADIYALGVVCYRALTGSLPYTGRSAEAVVRSAARGRHKLLTDIVESFGLPVRLAEVVESAIAHDPSRRFGSAEELAGSLRSAIDPGSVQLPGLPENPVVPTADDDLTGATDTFGPRPPAPKEPHVGLLRRLGRRLVGGRDAVSGLVGVVARRPLVAGLVAAGVMFGSGVVLIATGGSSGDTATGSDDHDSAFCVNEPEPEVDAGAQVIPADINGDGCLNYAVYGQRNPPDGEVMVLSVELEDGRREIRMGEPGDQIVLGDWDCNGRNTPALYQPVEGRIYYFMVWPSDDRASDDLLAEALFTYGPPNGTAEVVEVAGSGDGDTCGDEVRIVEEAWSET